MTGSETTGMGASPVGVLQPPSRRSALWYRSSLGVKGLMLIAIPLLPLACLMAMLVFQASQDARVDRQVVAIRETRDATERLLATAVDAETGMRGYVATGNPVFLEPFDAAMANLEGLAKALETANVSPVVQGMLEDQYRLLLTLRQTGPALDAREREALLLRGKENMDGLRAELASHIDGAQTRLNTALEGRERLRRRNTLVLWLGALGGLAGGALGVVLFVREIAARIKVLQDNSRLLGGTEPLAKVRGKDEIAVLGDALEAARQELADRELRRKEAEADMIRSRDDADRANAAKSEFLSRMSHELRTPLNAILGFAQLLEMDDLDEDQHESVKHIVRGGNHLLDLINEVLDIARVETGRLSISVEPVAIEPLVEETVALVQPIATAQDIAIRIALSSGAAGAHVMGDRQRLKQILLNLLSNAIKYNNAGGSVDLTVDGGDDRVRVAVRDTGRGLDADQLGHLFIPFERLGAEGTDVEGTGLGLALSKHLAEAMGAAIHVSSAVGSGTTFLLDLVRGSDPNEAASVPGLEEVLALTNGAQVATILYIEDNLSNLTLVQSILDHRPGLRLVTAMRGSAGLDLAARHRPDMILLDLNLPDVDGGEVLRRLRRDDRTSAIPVVMVSADATPRQIERFKAAGAIDYVTKPLDVQRFLRVVDRALAEAVA